MLSRQFIIEWSWENFANEDSRIINTSFSFHKTNTHTELIVFSFLSTLGIFQSVQLQYSNSSGTLKPTMSASREAFTCNPKFTEPTNCSWNSRPKSTSKISMEANKKANRQGTLWQIVGWSTLHRSSTSLGQVAKQRIAISWNPHQSFIPKRTRNRAYGFERKRIQMLAYGLEWVLSTFWSKSFVHSISFDPINWSNPMWI